MDGPVINLKTITIHTFFYLTKDLFLDNHTMYSDEEEEDEDDEDEAGEGFAEVE